MSLVMSNSPPVVPKRFDYYLSTVLLLGARMSLTTEHPMPTRSLLRSKAGNSDLPNSFSSLSFVLLTTHYLTYVSSLIS